MQNNLNFAQRTLLKQANSEIPIVELQLESSDLNFQLGKYRESIVNLLSLLEGPKKQSKSLFSTTQSIPTLVFSKLSEFLQNKSLQSEVSQIQDLLEPLFPIGKFHIPKTKKKLQNNNIIIIKILLGNIFPLKKLLNKVFCFVSKRMKLHQRLDLIMEIFVIKKEESYLRV